jgi:hypothetical protein
MKKIIAKVIIMKSPYSPVIFYVAVSNILLSISPSAPSVCLHFSFERGTNISCPIKTTSEFLFLGERKWLVNPILFCFIG